MAPFTPFLTEHMYQNLRRCQCSDLAQNPESVHFCDVPAATQESAGDQHIQQVWCPEDSTAWSILVVSPRCTLQVHVGVPCWTAEAVQQPQAARSTDRPPSVPCMQSVQRMQQVIELGRAIRDQVKKPLKVPLRSLVVVHTDTSFLQDIAGQTPRWSCILCAFAMSRHHEHPFDSDDVLCGRRKWSGVCATHQTGMCIRSCLKLCLWHTAAIVLLC